MAGFAHEDRFHGGLHIIVNPAPTDASIEFKGLVVRIEHQFLRLTKIGAHERHAAIRQLHMRCLDCQRQTLQRDRLVAPVELVGFAGGKAQRHKGMRRCPSLLVAPGFGETMHAVMRAVVTAASQFFEQTLRRPALSPRKCRLLLEDLGENIHPRTELGHRLHTARILERGLVAPDHLAHRRPRDAKRPHDLLNRQALLEISAPDIADHVHGHHPPNPSQAGCGQREGC